MSSLSSTRCPGGLGSSLPPASAAPLWARPSATSPSPFRRRAGERRRSSGPDDTALDVPQNPAVIPADEPSSSSRPSSRLSSYQTRRSRRVFDVDPAASARVRAFVARTASIRFSRRLVATRSPACDWPATALPGARCPVALLLERSPALRCSTRVNVPDFAVNSLHAVAVDTESLVKRGVAARSCSGDPALGVLRQLHFDAVRPTVRRMPPSGRKSMVLCSSRGLGPGLRAERGPHRITRARPSASQRPSAYALFCIFRRPVDDRGSGNAGRCSWTAIRSAVTSDPRSSRTAAASGRVGGDHPAARSVSSPLDRFVLLVFHRSPRSSACGGWDPLRGDHAPHRITGRTGAPVPSAHSPLAPPHRNPSANRLAPAHRPRTRRRSSRARAPAGRATGPVSASGIADALDRPGFPSRGLPETAQWIAILIRSVVVALANVELTVISPGQTPSRRDEWDSRCIVLSWGGVLAARRLTEPLRAWPATAHYGRQLGGRSSSGCSAGHRRPCAASPWPSSASSLACSTPHAPGAHFPLQPQTAVRVARISTGSWSAPFRRW